jgi:hypothetical protein
MRPGWTCFQRTPGSAKSARCEGLLLRVVPSGLVQCMSKSVMSPRWRTVQAEWVVSRWCLRDRAARLATSVVPPPAQGWMWSVAVCSAGRVQPGNRQAARIRAILARAQGAQPLEQHLGVLDRDPRRHIGRARSPFRHQQSCCTRTREVRASGSERRHGIGGRWVEPNGARSRHDYVVVGCCHPWTVHIAVVERDRQPDQSPVGICGTPPGMRKTPGTNRGSSARTSGRDPTR